MELRKILKEKIKKNNTINGFADKNNIRRATLIDYLNGKKDLTSKVLFRVLEPLGMGVNLMFPDKMDRVVEVCIEGKVYSDGKKFKKKEIESCWMDHETQITALVLKDKDSNLELKIV